MTKITIQFEDGEERVVEMDQFLLVGEEAGDSNNFYVAGDTSVKFLRLIDSHDIIGQLIKERRKQDRLKGVAQ